MRSQIVIFKDFKPLKSSQVLKLYHVKEWKSYILPICEMPKYDFQGF